MPHPPKLLVSVRNVDEAVAAVDGGADIVDVKEPSNGSLGRASSDTIIAIAETLRSQARSVPLSIALGEMCDWNFVDIDNKSALAAIADAAPEYVKLGLANAKNEARAWQELILEAQQSVDGQHKWVAVAYADFKRADAPSPIDVCRFAIRSKSAVLLIDTFRKDGTNLLSWMSRDQLKHLRSETAARGIRLALAGKVTTKDLLELSDLLPDIIAVRGAVCDQGDRSGRVSKELVRQFKEAIDDCQ